MELEKLKKGVKLDTDRLFQFFNKEKKDGFIKVLKILTQAQLILEYENSSLVDDVRNECIKLAQRSIKEQLEKLKKEEKEILKDYLKTIGA